MRDAGPMDVLCQGIGRSGHLAFNEPGGTDFDDPKWVRVVEIVEASRQQLMDDPNFKEIGKIPARGITMTIPALLSARHVFTMVPLATKREILTKVLSINEPTTEFPATILSRHEGTLFVDWDSCPAFLKP
jgi:glucosamine-6-phosphate deaminase